jgi:hypothetical protein
MSDPENVRRTDTDEPVDVALPPRIVARVEDRLPRTDFETSGEYITYVLEEVLAKVEAESDEEYSGVDETEMRERLQSLGYLDQ